MINRTGLAGPGVCAVAATASRTAMIRPANSPSAFPLLASGVTAFVFPSPRLGCTIGDRASIPVQGAKHALGRSHLSRFGIDDKEAARGDEVHHTSFAARSSAPGRSAPSFVPRRTNRTLRLRRPRMSTPTARAAWRRSSSGRARPGRCIPRALVAPMRQANSTSSI